MGLIQKFEARLERILDGSFAMAFPEDLQPIDIVGKLQKEITERAAVVSRTRTVVPNTFTVTISQADADRLGNYREELAELLAESIRDFATEQSFSFLGPVQVTVESDDSLKKGVFQVASQTIKVGPAQVDSGDPGTSLHPRLVDTAGSAFALSSDRVVLGRGNDVDIRFEDDSVSRRHAEIVLSGTRASIKDLGSTNGTFVDGMLTTQGDLFDGSVIRLGATDVIFRNS